MKTLKLLPLFLILILTSCTSVRVNADYDSQVDFTQFKTYAFHKNGVDKVQVSELDKRRILRAIDDEMTKKGYTKSDNPDMLINILTKERERLNVNQFNAGWGYGWGWRNPMFMMGGNSFVNATTEGTLYIDLIDAKKKELIWEGEGIGSLTENRSRKEEQINEFVAKIIAQFPPTQDKK
ncbi:DUF4136 domain-containing protein [Flavobacterium algicola]|uniref:DUF4136 domain-containing protein n=1 Tax=Flavobacterium algicola TaxID=556529 RepID=UPI001EFE0070|nr:DUF4136 domain-containing protein [Flavobacterium algicola]MCG9791283.1 DUF4136 domain-containing protein [Flavobacterium algicola]